jgi:hypothetical protein
MPFSLREKAHGWGKNPMTESENPVFVTGDRSERALKQQERAIDAINAIAAGADPSLEALRLANDFSDRQTARLTAWLRRSKSQP